MARRRTTDDTVAPSTGCGRSSWLNRHAAWLVLGACLALAAVSALYLQSNVERDEEREFVTLCTDVQHAIEARLEGHARVLASGAALFDASDAVSRGEWHAYTGRLRIEQQLPGVQGIGYVQLIPRADLGQHVEAVRAEGFPDYAVKPAGDRDAYSSIIYLEPFSGRNLRAFGYDMLSEPTRRDAMEQARDTDAAALSGKVILVLETDEAVQAGTLMYVPVYRRGEPYATVAERRAAITGWVYSPYRMTDLLDDILCGRDLRETQHLDLQVFDGEQAQPGSLLYRRAGTDDEGRPTTAAYFHHQLPVDFNGHRWTLTFAGPHGGVFAARHAVVWFALAGGVIVALLLSALVLVLQNARLEAQRMAEALTRDLKESELSYRNQFAANSSVMLLVNPDDGAIVDANDAALAFYGYTREQLLSMDASGINTLPAEKVRQVLADIVPGRANRYQMQHRLADGSVRDVEVAASRIHSAGRTLLHAIVQDITARRQAEEALTQTSERLSLAIRAGGVGIWDYDLVTGRLVWDDEMYRLYGIAEHEFTDAYETWLNGVHPEDRSASDAAVQAAIRGEKEYNTEFRVVHPDGAVRIIRALGIVQRDDDGRALRIIGTNWDTTAQKEADASMIRSESKFRALFESTGDAVMLLDEHGFIDGNGAALRMMGCGSREEFCTKDPADLSPPQQPCGGDSRELSRAWCSAAITTGAQRFEWMHRRADNGAVFAAEVVLSSLQIDGRPVVQAVVRDISERNAAAAELQATNRRLEEANVRATELALQAESASIAKSEFLANMSHEIRTPMNGVIGMTGLLLDTDLTADQRRYAQTVRASGEALLALINDILDFSKIEAGMLELETMDFNLPSLLDDFAGMMALRAHEKGLALGCVVEPGVPADLRGDPGRLRQILINLVGNAIKFTTEGQVAVRASVDADSGSDVQLRITVSDTGIGIPADKMERLFTKFSQVDSSTARTHGGTGLGLAISKQLAGIMGGEIGVRSEPGKGTTFWFTVRLAKAADSVPAPAPALADLQTKRVLVVDSVDINRDVLMTLLAAWGLRPVGAVDGRAALDLLGRARDDHDPFEVAILNSQLPDLTGAALVHAIRFDDALKDTRLVVCSSLCQAGGERPGPESGFIAELTMPVRRPELQEALEATLRGARPAPDTGRAAAKVVLRPEFAYARILVAEDNITNQMVAVGILRKLGLRADVAANGIEAVKALEAIPYDLVLMDVQMPEMDGIEATRHIRNAMSHVPDHGLPIVAMTAHALGDDRARCLEAGMNDYITKPVRVATLVAALEKWLPPRDTGTSSPIEPDAAATPVP